MEQSQFQCLKCHCMEYEQGQIRATGGFWAKLFNVQNKKFFTLSCKQCGFTEMYSRKSSVAGNVFDWMAG